MSAGTRGGASRIRPLASQGGRDLPGGLGAGYRPLRSCGRRVRARTSDATDAGVAVDTGVPNQLPVVDRTPSASRV